MKVVYTENIPKHPEPGVCYRSSFLGVIGGATSVEVNEDFPNADLIDQAYAHLGNQLIHNKSKTAPKKPTAAEAKATKADEEAKEENQPKE